MQRADLRELARIALAQVRKGGLREVGCTQRLVSEIERGKPTVAFETVLRIANGLGIDLTLNVRGK